MNASSAFKNSSTKLRKCEGNVERAAKLHHCLLISVLARLSRDRMAEQRRERKQFSFELKYRILQELGRGRKKSDVAKQFGISLSTLSTFIKDAPRVESGITSATFNPVRKRLRTAKHEDIDDAVYIWFQDVRSKNIHRSQARCCVKKPSNILVLSVTMISKRASVG